MINRLVAVLNRLNVQGLRNAENSALLDLLPALYKAGKTSELMLSLHDAVSEYSSNIEDQKLFLKLHKKSLRLQTLMLRPQSAENMVLIQPVMNGTHSLSYNQFQALKFALEGRGSLDILSNAINDGTAITPYLLPYYLLRLENPQASDLTELCEKAITLIGAEVLPVLRKRYNTSWTISALKVLMTLAGSDSRCELYNIAASSCYNIKTRCFALSSLASFSQSEDIPLISALLKPPLYNDAALALSGMYHNEAEQNLLNEAEALLRNSDFSSLSQILKAIRLRIGANVETPYSQAVFDFYSKLTPYIISLPGYYPWLVEECIEAVAAFNSKRSVSFLEEMLAFAEHQAKRLG